MKLAMVDIARKGRNDTLNYYVLQKPFIKVFCLTKDPEQT